jgi:hypothetical protein
MEISSIEISGERRMQFDRRTQNEGSLNHSNCVSNHNSGQFCSSTISGITVHIRRVLASRPRDESEPWSSIPSFWSAFRQQRHRSGLAHSLRKSANRECAALMSYFCGQHSGGRDGDQSRVAFRDRGSPSNESDMNADVSRNWQSCSDSQTAAPPCCALKLFLRLRDKQYKQKRCGETLVRWLRGRGD